MQLKYIIRILLVMLALMLLSFFIFKLFNNNGKIYSQKYSDSLISKQVADSLEFENKLEFAHGQIELQGEANKVHIEKIELLEHAIDSMIKKHSMTKKYIKQYNSDTGFVIAPNEYVQQCEACYDTLQFYRNENKILRFERDSYDSLLIQSSTIQADRIKQLELQKLQWNKLYNDCILKDKSKIAYCDTTRKLKIGISGMANNLFIPRAAGFSLTYEDKKFNDFSAHVLFSTNRNIYILNVSKTISFKRKKL